jgi:hypothetical protein
MRDLVVREALMTMSRDAAKRLRELIAAGNEIPYEVREPGDGSPLCRYLPLTSRFIREQAGALRELDSFGAACAAIESADLAEPYLERLGVSAPPVPRERAELAGIAFLCRLWLDSTDFSLDRARLEAAIDEVQAKTEASTTEIEVAVPLRGLQLPVARLDLATATIVRSDTVEVPPEARSAEGLGAAAWEPTFLAVARIDDAQASGEPGEDSGARAVEAFRILITTLRLFKPGGVALGPHAWTRVGADRWRRIATGAGRPRPGGYRLAESELGDLVAFSRMLADRWESFDHPARDRDRDSAPGRPGLELALSRSIARFEAGLERDAVLEALNDYLLSLRFLLEGGGPAELGLPMRVAALCAEPESRSEVKAVIERATALERELWSGEPAPAEAGSTPAETAADVEDLLRAILKDTACGHLGFDLRATADEILLADGLAIGDGALAQRGETAEWRPPEAEEIEEGEEAEELAESEQPAAPAEGAREPAVEWVEPAALREEAAEERGQVPEPPQRISVEEIPEPEEEEVSVHAQARTYDDRPTQPFEVVPEPLDDDDGQSPVARLLERRSAEREEIADRVAHLFPPPETTEWEVREISYDRRRRARVAAVPTAADPDA